MKRRFLICLFLLVIAGLHNKDMIINEPIVFNTGFTQKSVNSLWKKIRARDKFLLKDKVITIYLNSNGGHAQPSVVLFERIDKLQNAGRKFHMVIYGYCYSACGTLFAMGNRRYMTKNAVYMQHKAYSVRNTTTDRAISHWIDVHRLRHDAYLLKEGLYELIDMFKYSDFISPADYMLSQGMIHGIVPQPDIDEI